MQFLLSELAGAVGGRVIGADVSIDGVSIDSRSVSGGQLFVPLVAERDGHEFIPGAVAAGAAAYLTARHDDRQSGLPDDVSAVEVADTADALTSIGRLARSRLGGHVIGITGSVGKTSVKDLTLAACSGGGSAWASAASFNNELGVPLTLANTPTDSSRTIVEMGARGIGHIRQLCEVARPTVGVVTCVALAHSELFGSLEAVAQGKGELVEAVPADGIAVLNANDPLVSAMAERTDAAIVRYGSEDAGGSLNVRFQKVTLDRLLRPTFVVESDWGRGKVSLGVRGAHMAQNAAAALAVALSTGVGFDDAVSAMEQADLSPWRMAVSENAAGMVVINDAYNANPTSMRAALDSLVQVDADVRVAVLGLMAELGEEGPSEHAAVAAEASKAGIHVIAVEAPEYGDQAHHVIDRDEALDAVTELLGGAESPAVLVKGSRVAELERLAERLLTQ